MMETATLLEDITVLNMYAASNRAIDCIRQKSGELQGEIVD